MKNEIIVSGHQKFMGRSIPVIVGGFGPGERCISDKTAAELHGMQTKHVREIINRNIARFDEAVDFIDAKKVVVQNDDNFLNALGYSRMEISKAEHIYILSRRGYFKLVKILETDQAWDVYDKLLDDYFIMEDHIQNGTPLPGTDYSALSPQLQLLISMEVEQKRQAAALETVEQKVDGIREIVAINPQSWREECRRMLAAVAQLRGGGGAYQEVNAEAAKIVNERAGVSLETRLTYKRRRMADEGVCKSKRDKLTKVDVIADDKKLIEIYIAVVKEMAIKYGVDWVN